MRLLTFLAGAAAGYVLGTRSGRDSYDQMKAKVLELWEDPRPQEKLGKLGDTTTASTQGTGAADGRAPGQLSDSTADPAHRVDNGDGWEDEGGSGTRRPADDDY